MAHLLLILDNEIIIAPPSYINSEMPYKSDIILQYGERVQLWELIDLDNIEHSNFFLFPELKHKYKTLPIRILEGKGEREEDEPAG